MNRFPDIDPYDVLGLSPGCTAAEIKASYKKLALKNHPDRAPPAEKEDATARFKVVGQAYELLSDERKRREYDAFRPGSTQGYTPAEPYYEDRSRQHFGTSPNGVPFSFMWESSADSARRAQAGRRAGRPFGADGFDPFELFNMMFGKEFGSAGGANMGGMPGPSRDPFATMNQGHGMGGSIFGEDDPFMQNHRRMADTMGFGFGSPFGPPRGHPGAHPGQPARMQATGPFAHGYTTSTSTSTTYGGFSGTSQSTTTRTVNGRTETVTRTVDGNGNVTVHTSAPEGSSVHINGVLQQHHPLLPTGAPPHTFVHPAAGPTPPNHTGAGTADNPIVFDTE
ncbi:DnaJ-domain-containing protein [Moesziomyces antarcticus]|uniref:DnaJ-domain-containing protein n=2 Tax=Pseudozyma antarctica TaxID=84753 RepID=A0A081CIK9_PSEA2|nr:DnaJ-domain-containing protein [Moesziomyces antarcticus]GAK66505.1 DnaJ-domain-containing protein [Moesziomyces antarcticus]SPO47550.1 uncharacterized protein PSANT_05238 [Moesziomyces antarcticus]